MRVLENEARTLAQSGFMRAGVPQKQAEDAAEILTLAEMMGIHTHGLARVADYVRRIAAGGINACSVASVSTPAAALRLINGDNGLGPAVARLALDEALAAARQLGLGAAFVRNSSHMGALAPYLWIAAKAGFACVISSNTAPMIAPAGGREARIGNNPLGIGVPNPGHAPVVLDMALSVAARSRIRAAARDGVEIPEEWASDASGRPTSDPAKAMQGLMRAIGGDKGANLALCLDLLSGLLSGAAILTEIPNAAKTPGTPQNLGHMIIALDTAQLVPADRLVLRMAQASSIIAHTQPARPDETVRMPGTRADAALNAARRDGLDLTPKLLEQLRSLAL